MRLPALDVLLEDLQVSLSDRAKSFACSARNIGGPHFSGQRAIGRTGSLGADVRVRHIIGLDPHAKALPLLSMWKRANVWRFAK